MKKHRFWLLASVILLGSWAVLCIFASFLGSQAAASFFRSGPLAIFWFIWVLFLLFSLRDPKVWMKPFLLLLHLGTLFVFAGGLWGAPKSFEWRNRFGGASEIAKGYLILSEQEQTNKVYDAAGRQIGSLPFDFCLEKFTITYYDLPSLRLFDKNTRQNLCTLQQIPEDPVELEGGLRLEVLRRYKNLQLRRQQGRAVPAEGPAQIRNPGFELKLLWPDGTEEYYYVWEQNDFWTPDSSRCIVSYSAPQMPRQYESRISIQHNGKTTAHSIRVNRPLSYGGYIFIQQSWGEDEKGYYSILGLVSNRGFPAVLAGYCLLMLGAAGHFWLVPLLHTFRKERHHSD